MKAVNRWPRSVQRTFGNFRNLLQFFCLLLLGGVYCFLLGNYAVAGINEANSRVTTYTNSTIITRQQTQEVTNEEDVETYDVDALEAELEERKLRVWQVCAEKGLGLNGQANAWEFFVDSKHHLIWCNIFKAASSTWMYNFNLLAGYEESFLRRTKKTPLSLARAHFPRPTTQQLKNELPNSMSFLIVREPFERLLSAYRNKIEGMKHNFYRKLAREISERYRRTASPGMKLPDQKLGPTFPEFVNYVIESDHFDEHWAPYYTFCTPCHVNFSVIAKMETLERDQEYIIRKAGLQKILMQTRYRDRPKRILNKARDGKETSNLLEKYYSQLSLTQLQKLYSIYSIDFEMFGYNASKYFSMHTDKLETKLTEPRSFS